MPVWFIGGTRDGVIAYRPGYVEAMAARLPDHRGTTLIEGAGHWTQQEAPAGVQPALLAALADLDAPAGAARRASGRTTGRRHPRPVTLCAGGQWSSRPYAHHSNGLR